MAKKILIVDDSASVRMVARIALRDKGYDVLEAINGRDALDKLAGERVNLVVSDVNMPIMDGISFVKELKGNPATKFVPVIMLTTEAGQDKMQEGRAAGAKAWITKPFQPATLLDAVSKLVLA